jgi:hypothetical protein
MRKVQKEEKIMHRISRSKIWVLCGAVAALLMAAPYVEASRDDDGYDDYEKKSKQSKVKVEVEAKMWPVGSPAIEPNAKGEAKHEQETKNGALKKDKFEGEVKIPVGPTSGLGIVDEATARNADIRLLLSRAGASFAECRLDFYKIERKRGRVMAEYKVEVRMQSGAVQARWGECDVDVTNVDAVGDAVIDSGIPNAQANDVSTALLVDSTEEDLNPGDRTIDEDVLQGMFVVHY